MTGNQINNELTLKLGTKVLRTIDICNFYSICFQRIMYYSL